MKGDREYAAKRLGTLPIEMQGQILQMMKYIDRGEIPPKAPGFMFQDLISQLRVDTYSATHPWRDLVTDRGMWAFVDLEWTKQLADFLQGRRVLEVMAGMGWLAKALAQHGVNIVATDNHVNRRRGHHLGEPVYPVKHRNADRYLRKNADSYDALIISWPPFGEAIDCDLWGTKKPVIYIGEGHGGCTGTDEFHDRFEIDQVIRIPHWPAIHDDCFIGRFT